MGIVPQTFEEFVDKDRVKNVRRLIDEEIAHVSRILTHEQISEAKDILGLVPKFDKLESLIRAQEAKENLAKTENEWKYLDEQRQKKAKPWNTLLIWSLVALFGGAFVISIAAGSIANSLGINSIGGLLCCWMGISFTGIAIAIDGSNRAVNQRLRDLNKERSLLAKDLLPPPKMQELYREFGEKASQDYSALRNKVMEYIKNVTEKDTEGANLPEPLLQLLIPSKILKSENAVTNK